MSPRYAARRDENERPIIDALRAAGWGVEQIDKKGVPDLIIAKGKRTMLVEVIGNEKWKKYKPQGLTPDQVAWHRDWPGEVYKIRSVEDALAVIRWEER